ncbi:MAG: T9SS type A sorting domain-containing protein [Crocinitomicaceae bacterium]|nr:T9SS type A sorting domain-containing protein [Crocinitomicaceae bacterium]
MNLLINTTKAVFLLTAIFISTSTFAITYTSVNSGAWDNTVNVWSTDGGASACGCEPGTASAGNDIIINHIITNTNDLVFHATSTITVNAGGTLSMPLNKLNMWNANIIVNGSVVIKDAYYAVGSITTINATGNMTFTSNFDIENGGTVTLDGGWIISQGNIKLHSGSILNVNSGFIDVQNGNIENQGTINIGSDACFHIDNGGFVNKGIGIVNGTGAVHITTNGVVTNEGTWSVTVDWCAADGGVDLPIAENCATGDCFNVVLPVDLTDFSAAAVANDFVQLEWTTASENNSDYFAVMSSQDGKIWEEIGTVNAAGTTTETQYYSFEDYNVRYGTTYFKLIQVDFNNDTYESEVISVSIAGKEVEIGVSPNPINNDEVLTISNLEEGSGQVNIMNISGRVVITQKIDANQTNVRIQLSDLLPGIYIVGVEQLGAYKTKRLVIME